MYYYVDPIGKFLGDWATNVSVGSVAVRISLALILSAVVGCERASKRHAAGLRTFILICIASAMATVADVCLMQHLGITVPFISAAAMIGIAIISSNSILFSSKNQIKGLTTSAGLWACGFLGLLIGGGYYTIALIYFVFLYCGLSFFPPFERYLKNRSNHFEIHLELTDISYLRDFVTTIRRLGLKIDDIESNPAYINSGLSVYSISLTINSKELKKYKTHSEIIEALGSLEYVNHIEEMT